MSPRAGAALAVVAVVAALMVACSDGSPETAPSESPEPGASATLVFSAEAASRCTEIVNEAVAGPGLPSPNTVYSEVLAAISSGDEPAASRRDQWAGALDKHLTAVDATKTRLATLTPPTDDLRAAWDTVVTAYDDTAAVQRARAAALRNGSWPEVRTEFGSSSASSELVSALEPIGLGATDCAHVFSPDVVQPPAQWRTFTSSAAAVCTEIANRRLLGRYADDTQLVEVTVAEVAAGEKVSAVADLDDALGRISAEWRSTADDFASIEAADSPSPETWDRLGELAGERALVAEQQRAATATSNDAAMAAAFATPDHRLRSYGFELLLLEGRSCGGLTA